VIHIKAPNGLLVALEPYAEGPCGVGWTSDPSAAHKFSDTGDARWWAKQNAPVLYGHVVTALGRAYRYGDLRFPEAP
jgi:hypothetical protein